MFCPRCGSKNPDGAKFCFNCGGSLSQEGRAPQQKAVPAPEPAPAAKAAADASERADLSVAVDAAPASKSAPSEPPFDIRPSAAVRASRTAAKMHGIGAQMRNSKAKAACIVFGPLYTIVGIGMATQGQGSSEAALGGLVLAAYGVWLVVGIFTRGWRLVIY